MSWAAIDETIDEKLVEERLTALESARTWSPLLISKLESHIRSANDTELLRINPLKFAADKNLAETETVDLFLHATALGLFEMNWVILCPLLLRDRQFSGSAQSRQPLPRTICHVDHVADLDDMIAIGFTVSPSIRRIAYHDPEGLSPADYFFRYRATMEGMVPDGTPFTVLKEMATQALGFLGSG